MGKNKILTVDEMRNLDICTCQYKGISSLELMHQAGKKLYECLLDEYQLDKMNDQICIVSGIGNNGGDSLCVGCHLLEHSYNVKIIIVGNTSHLTIENQTILDRLIALQADILFLTDTSTFNSFSQLIDHSTLVIDGLFGIGLNRNIEGMAYKVIEKINDSQAFVFSIDIPSGINGNNGNVANIAILADFTAIIQNYKVGNLLNDAKDYHGNSKIIDIGILQNEIKSNRYLLIDNQVLGILPKRKNNTHKYHYGSVLTIGGSQGMTGAPLMSAYSALRTGTGLSTIALDEKYLQYMNSIYPELLIKTYKCEADVFNMTTKKNVIIFGPGLGREGNLNLNILARLLEMDIPLVIDADGLYYLKQLLHNGLDGKNIIITPHFGEMAALSDIDIKNNPLTAIYELTEKYHMTIVLKGPCTIIANKDEMYFCNIGNPGMATAGSGDVLTGMIASLVGQGLSLLDSCKLGVVLHSKAGNWAKEEMGEYSLVATDIIQGIPNILKEFSK